MIKVTFILRDLTDAFFEGRGDSIVGLNNMDHAEKFAYLNKSRIDLSRNIKMKIGTGQFRDAVELNGLIKKADTTYHYKIEPRKGYNLVTFEIN